MARWRALGISTVWATPPAPVFPLKQDPANHYLIDSNNVPFLMVGDAPQAMVGNLSEHLADVFMANRAGPMMATGCWC
ncbi:MAG TPA: hypothetical protein VIJ62_14930 [Rhizomicrobium sp.]